MTVVRRGVIAALLAGAALAACTEVSTDPNLPVSLQFDSLPSGAVVLNDTMRGDDLQPTALRARVFNGAGTAISNALLRLIGTDTLSIGTFAVSDGLQLTGKVLSPTVNIVAQAGTLQSQTQTFAVVAKPTLLARFAADSADSVIYDPPDTANRYRDTRVGIFADTVALNGLRVRFRLVSFTDSLLDSAKLVSSANGKAVTSALMSGGQASVRLRVWAKPGARGRGTVAIEASHKALGVQIPNSPLSFIVRVVPYAPPP